MAAAAFITAFYFIITGQVRVLVANHALPRAELAAVVAEANLALPVPITDVRYTSIRVPPADITIASRATQLYAAARGARLRRLDKGYSAVHFVTDTLSEGYLGGLALRVCSPRDFNDVSISNMRPGRHAQNVTAMVHEISHTLGAEHVPEVSWMHPDALAYAKTQFAEVEHYTPASKALISQCLRVNRTPYHW